MGKSEFRRDTIEETEEGERAEGKWTIKGCWGVRGEKRLEEKR